MPHYSCACVCVRRLSFHASLSCALQLSFFAKEGGDKQGDIPLSATSDVALSGELEFTVVGADGTKLFCEAPDAAARDGWVKAIMQNIISLRASS